ncbi:MAG: hypothetical protein ABIK89_25845, partial [Planctomycetota bacterium]
RPDKTRLNLSRRACHQGGHPRTDPITIPKGVMKQKKQMIFSSRALGIIDTNAITLKAMSSM